VTQLVDVVTAALDINDFPFILSIYILIDVCESKLDFQHIVYK